jgi:hypothetical protein
MSIRIRTRRANGQENEELYPTEADGLQALERNLSVHRRAGHTVTTDPLGTRHTVTDANGNFVQESWVIRSA